MVNNRTSILPDDSSLEGVAASIESGELMVKKVL